MAYDTSNVFAKILRGEISCSKVHESDHALAFKDIAPQAPVHILIIPKGPFENAGDFALHASPEEKADFWSAVGAIVKQENLKDGYRLIANAGDHGHQDVPHFHMHLLAGEKLGPMRAR